MLTWNDAKALMDEADRLHYKGTMYERSLVERLTAMTPKVLTAADERALVRLYRRAAGGEMRRWKTI